MTPAFRISMHSELRKRVIQNLKQRGARDDSIVFIEGIGPGKLNYDGVIPNQRKEFLYLTGVTLDNYKLVISVGTEETYLFIPRYTDNDKVWDRYSIPTPESAVRDYGVTRAAYHEQLESIINGMRPSIVYTLSDQKLPFNTSFSQDKSLLASAISASRVTKTAKEIQVMRVSIQTSALAHIEYMKSMRPGIFEYQMQNIFESYGKACGLFFQAYYPIMAGGERGAVLHYIENNKVVTSDMMVLVDAGLEAQGYATDITRSFPANGKFSADQRAIYEIVLGAQQQAIAALRPGASWPDISALANRVLLEGLRKHQFLVGANINDMINAGVVKLFMPHGLGHSLGLLVHDVPALPSLLGQGMVLTVEPGIYFHKFLFEGATPVQKRFLNMTKIEKFYKFGGVRIEDDLLVTSNGYENLSKDVPSDIEAIERLMQPSKLEKRIFF